MKRYQLVEIDRKGQAKIRILPLTELRDTIFIAMATTSLFEEGMIKRAGRTFYLRPIT